VLVAIVATFGGVAHTEPKREIPDYDGRGNPDADAGAWPLWIPRVVLSPLYVANEYVLRRPLAAFIGHAERGRWTDTFTHLFRFGEGGRSLIVPLVWFDDGALPSVGAYYAAGEPDASGNTLAIQATTWGPRSMQGSVADRYAIDPIESAEVHLAIGRSDDHLFLGLGPGATTDTRSRYALERVEVGVGYRRQLGDTLRLDAEAGVHHAGFLDGTCCGDPALDTRIARGEVMAPPGYREAYTAAHAHVDLALDARRPRPEPGSGGYLHAWGRPSVDVHGGRSWLEYGGVAGGALDLTGHRRTLHAQIALDLVDALSGSTPFTEYPVLGGEVMSGFLPGWMTGRSTAAAELGYSWPIWLGLDARARFAVGNAFGAHLAGLSPNQLRMSGDLGLTTDTDHERGFALLVGIGTETFEHGSDVTSVRVMFGTRWGS
jgi:hypothetical protein